LLRFTTQNIAYTETLYAIQKYFSTLKKVEREERGRNLFLFLEGKKVFSSLRYENDL